MTIHVNSFDIYIYILASYELFLYSVTHDYDHFI